MDNIYNINPSINVALATTHGFIKNENLTPEYKTLQKKYYLILEAFLCQKLRLKELEIKLDNSNRFFNKKNELVTCLGIEQLQLGYFFIRNNLNIETLSSDELNILRYSKDIKQLYNLIETTFLDVIKVNSLYGKKIEDTRILYDGTSESYLKQNSSLVMGFIDDLTSKKISDDEWEVFSFQRDEIKNKIFSYIETESLDKMNCQVEFVEYSLSLLKSVRKDTE